MLKPIILSAGTFIASNGFFMGIYLQLVPNPTVKSAVEAYLIAAIVALVGTITALFIYSKQLNKATKTQSDLHSQKLESIFKDQIKDRNEIIEKNTEAFVQNATATREATETSKENAKALTELRILLIRALKIN